MIITKIFYQCLIIRVRTNKVTQTLNTRQYWPFFLTGRNNSEKNDNRVVIIFCIHSTKLVINWKHNNFCTWYRPNIILNLVDSLICEVSRLVVYTAIISAAVAVLEEGTNRAYCMYYVGSKQITKGVDGVNVTTDKTHVNAVIVSIL